MFFRYVSRSEVAVVLSQDIDAYNVQPLMPPVHAGATENILMNRRLKRDSDASGGVERVDTKRLRKDGEKRLGPCEKDHRKRMATMVSVYEIAPYFRTPIQVLYPDENTVNKLSKPCRKRIWARVEDDLAAVIDQGFLGTIRHGATGMIVSQLMEVDPDLNRWGLSSFNPD